jgi:hypothetical protein
MLLTRNVYNHEDDEQIIVKLIPSLGIRQADKHHHDLGTSTSGV